MTVPGEVIPVAIANRRDQRAMRRVLTRERRSAIATREQLNRWLSVKCAALVADDPDGGIEASPHQSASHHSRLRSQTISEMSRSSSSSSSGRMYRRASSMVNPAAPVDLWDLQALSGFRRPFNLAGVAS